VSNPWAFGWTQLLTIIGFIITICIAVGGFRTFGRWKRERIEEKKIEIAFEALAFAYEAVFVINAVRAPIENPAEWSEMPKVEGETEEDRKRRAPAYVVWKRMDFFKDFFQHLFKLQPRFMATFGSDKEEIFSLVHVSLTEIQIASWIKAFDTTKDEDAEHQKLYEELREKLKSVILTMEDDDDGIRELDRVGGRLKEFRESVESLCKPIVDREYRGCLA
jgi:hypothetical protein